MERIYTIPLREVFDVPKPRRANSAVRVVKEFLARHMKAKEVKIDGPLNEALWKNSREKPPRRIKVKAVKEEGAETVTASLVAE